MQTKKEHDAIDPLLEAFRLHTRLFKNVLNGVKENDEQRRIADHTNHLAWMAGNLVSVRYMMANMLGAGVPESYPELFARVKGIRENVSYPALEQQIREWESISEQLDTLCRNVDHEKLLAPSSFEGLPVSEDSVFNALTFWIDRESYVIGQMALLRKAYGYDAMKYD